MVALDDSIVGTLNGLVGALDGLDSVLDDSLLQSTDDNYLKRLTFLMTCSFPLLAVVSYGVRVASSSSATKIDPTLEAFEGVSSLWMSTMSEIAFDLECLISFPSCLARKN